MRHHNNEGRRTPRSGSTQRHGLPSAEVRTSGGRGEANAEVRQPTTTWAAQRRSTQRHDDKGRRTPRFDPARQPEEANAEVGQSPATWVAQCWGTQRGHARVGRTTEQSQLALLQMFFLFLFLSLCTYS